MIMTREKLLAVSYDEIRLDRSAIHYGHLILVNREHPVQLKESSLDLLPLTDICSLDENLQLFLEKTCLQQLSALVTTCQGRDDIIAEWISLQSRTTGVVRNLCTGKGGGIYCQLCRTT